MDEKQFNHLKKRLKEVATKCHKLGLTGMKFNKTLRSITTGFEIRHADQEEKKVEKSLTKLEKDVQQHYVKKAQKDEKTIGENVELSLLNMYRALYNQEIVERSEIMEIENTAVHVIKSKKLSREAKDLIKEKLLKIIDFIDNDNKNFRKKLNEIMTKSRGGISVHDEFFKLLHTRGASVMRRRQEWVLYKDALKEINKAKKHDHDLPGSKTRKQLDKDLDIISRLFIEGTQHLAKSKNLISTEMEEVMEDLKMTKKSIDAAVLKHELPKTTSAQWEWIIKYTIELVTEPFLHSLQLSENQLEGITARARGMVKKI